MLRLQEDGGWKDIEEYCSIVKYRKRWCCGYIDENERINWETPYLWLFV